MFPLTPALSLKGEGVLRAGIILWGSLNPQGEGIKHYGIAGGVIPK